MNEIALTADQQEAYREFAKFVKDPHEHIFVLGGYAGTGKTTLVTKLLTDLHDMLKTLRLIQGKDAPDWDVKVTATTNTAAEVLERATGHETSTIHSLLGLIVHKDYKTGETTLTFRGNAEPPENTLIFIDEASFIDRPLLKKIMESTATCKVVFIGDPAQLSPVKSKGTPVFDSGFKGAVLTEIVRQQEGSQISALAAAFRDTVNGEGFFSFKPDGVAVHYMEREDFEDAIIKEFSRTDWKYSDSKVLAWTNACVINYNHAIREVVQGDPQLQVGDYAVCNKYINNKRCNLKTDQLVQVTSIKPHKPVNFLDDESLDGFNVVLDNKHEAFFPKCLDEKKALIKKLQKAEKYSKLQHIDNHWIDLRAAFACTINKSQGSTFDRIFIDLDDVKKCRNANQLARMLYVAVSRARHEVVFTGDLV